MSGDWCEVNQTGKGVTPTPTKGSAIGTWIWIFAVVVCALSAAAYIWYKKSSKDVEDEDDELLNPYDDNIEMQYNDLTEEPEK